MFYDKIIKHGKFYYPASQHYLKQPWETHVSCDRCHRQNIICCIGYDDFDLCMVCVQIVAQTLYGADTSAPTADNMLQNTMIQPDMFKDRLRKESQLSPLTFMRQDTMIQSDMFKDRLRKESQLSPLTFMCQDTFKYSPNLTKMIQSQFTPYSASGSAM